MDPEQILHNAQMVNLCDRGVLQEGKTADIVRVQLIDELPMVRAIWKNGRLVLNSC
jgi:alpha-D-ribose 1-methylphosphonate 5-triphosphate diphosphatase